MQLRDYQKEGMEAIRTSYEGGVRRGLIVWPTGAGKTVLFSSLVREWLDYGRRALVLAHRDKLIQQAVEKVGCEIKGEQIGIVKAEQNRYHAPCVVASVQTLANMKRLNQMPQFDLVIIDEAHRSTAKAYRQIVEHCAHSETLVLGVTATPDRTDKNKKSAIPLSDVYEKIIHEVKLLDLIERGFLVDIRAKNVGLPLDLEKIKTKKNLEGFTDYDANELAIAMEAANWSERVFDAWIDYACDRRTIAFVPRVAMGYRLAEVFRERGVSAQALDGSTPQHEQRRVVKSFEAGETQVLVNCDLFVEGADIPSISCVVMARPTKSRIVYSQAVGRGTRLSPETGKTDLLVLDVTGVTKRLELQTAATLARVAWLNDGETITQARKRETKELEELEAKEAAELVIKEALQAQEVELFRQRAEAKKKEEEAKKRKGFKWFFSGKSHKLMVGKITYSVSQLGDGNDAHSVTACHRDLMRQERCSVFKSEQLAKDFCEEKAREIIFAPSARWRRELATEAQLTKLKKWRIAFADTITKGEASDLINARIEQAKQRKVVSV